MDLLGWAALAVVAVILYALGQAQAKRARRARLLEKYGDEEVVDGIMSKSFWQGMTAEMLVDSLGEPEDIGRRVLKSKTSETYKYSRTGYNRYATRIRVDNGVVVGWDLK